MSDLPLNSVKFGVTTGADNATAAIPIASLSNIIHLTAGYNSQTQNAFYPFQKAGVAQAQYQVTTAKTLRVIAAYANGNQAGGMLFGYATATFTENNTGTPTGAVYFSGGSSGITAYGITTANTMVSLPNLVGMSFPATTYPFVKVLFASANQFSITLACVEQ